MEREKIKLTANILFSGIGCQERGFENSGLFDIEVLNTSEINKEAVLSYAAVHCGLTKEMIKSYKNYPSKNEMAQYLTDINLGYEPEKNKCFNWFRFINRKSYDLEKYWLACKLTNNLGDISKIKELPYADFWTVSFPCTDISVCGKMKGLNQGSGTRSSLLWENIRLLKSAKENNTLPKYIMFENVKNLVSKKFIDSFNDLLNILNELNFNTYWEVINGKDCGIPQNRERVFAIAVRKDIDKGRFTFPKPFDNGMRLKDVLEEKVDEKYYISQEKVDRFIRNLKDKNIDISNFCGAKDNKVKQIGNISNGKGGWENTQTGRIYSINGCSPVLNACGGGNREPKIIQIGRINSSQDGIVISKNGIAPAHTAGHENAAKVIDRNSFFEISGVNMKEKFNADKIRIRKLTPKECWRLMGLNDNDCDKASAVGMTNTQLYKQAGNGIITNCVELLAEYLYKAQYNDSYICTDEKYQENFCYPKTE